MFRLYFIGFFISFYSIIAQTNSFDIHHISAEITPNLEQKSVSGQLNFSFSTSQDTDSVFLDAKDMSAQIIDSDVKTSLNISKDKLWFVGDFEVNQNYNINFSYEAKQKQTLYFVGFEDEIKTNDQIFTQGQGKYTSHWLPSIDNMNDKIEFDLTLIIPKYYGALANGKLIEQWDENDSLSRWSYDMKKPMSSYLVAISIGDYIREINQSKSGVELHRYLLKKDSLYLEPTYRHTKEIFDYLENKIGVDYPWQNYKQVPVRDFLYAGMENTSLTIFSDAFVVDSIGYFDRNYINVNAHELAHQWFGNLVTETDSRHHWLHEGFATYYALLAERQIFGDNYFYHKFYEYAESLKIASDNGQGEKLLKPNASSLTYYQKGAWALFMLNQLVGEKVFDEAVQNFLNKYAFQNVTTANFMNEVKALVNIDLSNFEQQWFQQSAFQAEQALSALENALFIPKYFDLIAQRAVPFSNKIKAIEDAFKFPVNDYIAQEAVYQLKDEPATDEVIKLYQQAFNTDNLWVRQAISESLTEIPLALKSNYETLLQDQSYQTRENAFLNLWINFPKDRKRYLKQMQNQDGFRDKNLKQLWLTLNLATPDFQAEQTSQTYSQLEEYTSPKYRLQIREHAFGYLYQIESFSDQSLLNLLEGCFHHTWRFKDFCRQLLKTLLKNPTYQSQINNLKPKLNDKALTYLNKIS
ncbi:MAG: M1 family peptidase [Bacteroidetes bacterium]|jgi:aminopeptidase N|nr:M1 family peptidase [Bacteroidota bacterium]